MDEKSIPGLVGSTASLGSVVEEYMRMDKTIRDCEHAIKMADRLIAQGRWKAQWDRELAELHATLATTLREREWFDGVLTRAASA